MKILILSDIHGKLKHIERIIQYITESDVVLAAGDLSKTGDRQSAEFFIERIEKQSKKLFAVHGNWDSNEVTEMLEEKNIQLHGRGIVIDNIGFFGSGGSTPTPMKTPSEYTEDEIKYTINRGYENVKSAPVKILLSHTPPYSLLDRTFLGINAGSLSVLNFIENEKVDFCICGHIHEAHGCVLHGRTAVINAGSFASGRFALVDTDQKNIDLLKINFFGSIKVKETLSLE